MTNNTIVVDLNKVQFANLYWKNQYGNVKRLKPRKPTVHGTRFNPNDLHITEHILMIEFAQKHRLLDIWNPVCRLQLSSNHWLEYTGDKALSIYKEWNRRIFKPNK